MAAPSPDLTESSLIISFAASAPLEVRSGRVRTFPSEARCPPQRLAFSDVSTAPPRLWPEALSSVLSAEGARWGPLGPGLPFTMAQRHREGVCKVQDAWHPQRFGLRGSGMLKKVDMSRAQKFPRPGESLWRRWRGPRLQDGGHLRKWGQGGPQAAAQIPPPLLLAPQPLQA